MLKKVALDSLPIDGMAIGAKQFGEGRFLRGVGCWGSWRADTFSEQKKLGEDHGEGEEQEKEFCCRDFRARGCWGRNADSWRSGGVGIGKCWIGHLRSAWRKLRRTWATFVSAFLYKSLMQRFSASLCSSPPAWRSSCLLNAWSLRNFFQWRLAHRSCLAVPFCSLKTRLVVLSSVVEWKWLLGGETWVSSESENKTKY